MGLLDDAIREHLDLKRRRGADPAEIERAEQEALGPVRREPLAAEEPGLDFGHDAEPADPAALPEEEWEHGYDDAPLPAGEHPLPSSPEPPPLTLGGTQGEDPYAFEDEYEDEEEFYDEYEVESAADPARPAPHPADTVIPPASAVPPPAPPPAAPLPAAPPPAAPLTPEPAPPEPDEPFGETVEYDLESERREKSAGGDEDVLEETPEFLQDTPDHDRLWFEQKPPKDFDFDG